MKLRLDPNLMFILAALALGLLLPVSGTSGEVLDVVTKVAIFVLFFGYGARMSAAESLAGLKNWKLHAAILGTTFVIYPLIAVPMLWLPERRARLNAPARRALYHLFSVEHQNRLTLHRVAEEACVFIAADVQHVFFVEAEHLIVAAHRV